MGKGSAESFQGDKDHILKVHWQEQVKGEQGWCESQTSVIIQEEDVAFQEYLENEKKFDFQHRDG